MIRSKSFAIERAVVFISILLRLRFWTQPPSRVSRADYRVVLSFPARYFDAAKVSLASRLEHQEALSFCVQVTEEMQVGCSHFCHRLLFLSLWSEPLITYCIRPESTCKVDWALKNTQ